MTGCVDAHHPHLAAGGSALAARADAAADLRALRADPARLPIAEYLRRLPARGRHEAGLRAGELGAGTRSLDEVALVSQTLARETGWPHRDRRLCRHARRAMSGRSSMRWRAIRWCAASGCSCTGTTIRSIASRRCPIWRAIRRSSATSRGLRDYGWVFDLQVFADADGGCGRACRCLSRRRPSSCSMPACWRT